MAIAWLQRFITLGSLIFLGMLAAWLWDSRRGWAVACCVAPILITPLILGVQCLWAAQINRRDIAVRPASLGQWVRAWAAEWRAATIVFIWWQPFRHDAIANHLQPMPGTRGMVLVHGFFCNRALWMNWMQRLQNHGQVFVSVDLEPAFGSISDYADVVEAAIKQVEQATGMPPVLVGHSMGGLAIRAWAAKFVGSQGDMRRIHRIFTLGTPHQGTAIAVASYTSNGEQMRQGSRWLADNAAQLPKDFANCCTCYFSHCDNIVFPTGAATLPGADNQHVAGYAHVQLVFSNDIQQACIGHLES